MSDIRQPHVRRFDLRAQSDPSAFFALPFEDARGLHLVGELDVATVGLLVAALEALPDGADVLDLAGLSFMDGSGLHALEQHAATRNGAPPLVLENVSSQVRRLFELTGAHLDPDIEIRDGAARG
jgi:anti-anti-sigma factor